MFRLQPQRPFPCSHPATTTTATIHPIRGDIRRLLRLRRKSLPGRRRPTLWLGRGPTLYSRHRPWRLHRPSSPPSHTIRHLRTLFATFGVPEELASDGGPEFTASHTENFLRLWNVRHRVSSVSFPQSNGRAEVAVKTAKRLLMSNTSPTGSLDQDRFLRVMLQLHNTPDGDCSLSPAQIIFGRPLRDSLSFVNRLEKFSNPHIRPLWRQACAAKEEALRTRMSHTTESLKAHSRPLRPLAIGEKVYLQNQQGHNSNKWDRSGTVVESSGHDQYRVKVDGSGRLTLRNRRFLRAYTPATPLIQQQPPASLPPCSDLEQPPTSTYTNTAPPADLNRPGADEPSDTACDPSPSLDSEGSPPTPTNERLSPPTSAAHGQPPSRTRGHIDASIYASQSSTAPTETLHTRNWHLGRRMIVLARQPTPPV